MRGFFLSACPQAQTPSCLFYRSGLQQIRAWHVLSCKMANNAQQ